MTCPAGTTCQVIASNTLDSFSVVCAPQGEVNAQCRALFDEDACVAGDCVAVDVTFVDEQVTINALACRVACDANGAGTECQLGEVCSQAGRVGFAAEFFDELDAQGNAVNCTPSICENDGPTCECGEGFDCFSDIVDNVSVCKALKGMCVSG